MTPIADMIEQMVAGGVAMEMILVAVRAAELSRGNSGGIPVDVSAEKRRAYDRERKRIKKHSGGIPVENPRNSNVASIEEYKSKPSSRDRGCRIPADFEPDLNVALSRGMSRKRAETQAAKFKNYWMAKSGRDAVKLDWEKTWENWVISDLERNPPDAKPEERDDLGGFYAPADSPQLEAWDQFGLRTKGRRYPRDRSGGWRFPDEWPPTQQAAAE
jgi:hypothetical protein